MLIRLDRDPEEIRHRGESIDGRRGCKAPTSLSGRFADRTRSLYSPAAGGCCCDRWRLFPGRRCSAPAKPNSMFDWPDAIHTSPTSTSCNVVVFFPAIITSIGCSDAFIGSSVTHHRPLSSAVALPFDSPAVTVTCSPASAVPQTRHFDFTLQNHVVGKRRRDFHIGRGRRKWRHTGGSGNRSFRAAPAV